MNCRIQPVPASLIAASFLLLASAAAEEPRIEITGVSSSGAAFELSGPEAGTVSVEVSTDLIDWEAWMQAKLEVGEASLLDAVLPASPAARYYRARLLDPSELEGSVLIGAATVLGGDRVALKLEGWCDGVTVFDWLVDGIETGDATVGTVRNSPVSPCMAYYDAPIEGGTFEISAADPDDPERSVSVEVTVIPLTGDLLIPQGATTLALRERLDYAVGLVVPDLGFLPLRTGVWTLNGRVGTHPEFGRIELDGSYQAPPKLPSSLPASIAVEFRLTLEGEVAASVPLTLVDLDVTPESIVRYYASGADPEPQTTLSAQRHFSDGRSESVTPSELDWSSTSPAVASVNESTLRVTIGFQPGSTLLQAVDLVYPQTASVLVEGREPTRIRELQVHPWQDDSMEVRDDFVEVTRPNLGLTLDPRIYMSRANYSGNVDPPLAHSGQYNDSLHVSSTGDQVIVFDRETGGIPQLTGISARVEDGSFETEIGDTPGHGTLTFDYDNGDWQDSDSITLRYTQLELEVSAVAELSGGTDTARITEWINFQAALSNPYETEGPDGTPASQFIGRTPIKVEVVGGDPFWIKTDGYGRDGIRRTSTGTYSLETSKVTEYTLTVAQIPNPDPDIPFPPSYADDGLVRFAVSPTTADSVTFRVSVPSDPNIPSQDFTFAITQPELTSRSPAGPTLPDNQVVIGSTMYIYPEGSQPSPFEFEISTETPWTGVDSQEWLVKKGNGVTDTYPASMKFGLYEVFRGYFDQTGETRVTIAFQDRPELAFQELVLNVIDPGSLSPWPELGDNTWTWDGNTYETPTNLMIGAFKVITPLRPVWVPGVPIEVQIQCYDGAGNPGPVGFTNQTIRPKFNIDTYSTTVYYPGVLDGSYYEVVWPTYQHPEDGEQPQYMDEDGVCRFTIIPAEEHFDYSANIEINIGPASVGSDNLFFGGDRLRSTIYDEADTIITQPDRPSPSRQQAVYSNDNYRGLHSHTFKLSGHGMVLQPSQVPIPSQRVRDAVANGDLETGLDAVSVVAAGTEGFAESIASGLTDATVSEGFAYQSSEDLGDGKIKVTLAPDYAYWDAIHPALMRSKAFLELELVFGDGTRWSSELQVFRADLSPANPNGEWDIPLNGQYGVDSEPGAVDYDISIQGIRPTVDLVLQTSLHAAWDANGNGVADESEDKNGDGVFDEGDAHAEAANFRGALPLNPLVGFVRQANPDSGEIELRRLAVSRPMGGSANSITIYGNLEDRHRLDDQGNLAEQGTSDLIPDFVSPQDDSERFFVMKGENVADYADFTAYNFVAVELPIETEPDLEWKGEEWANNIEEAYEAYGDFALPSSYSGAADFFEDPPPISVFVDHEAEDRQLHFRQEFNDPTDYNRYLKGQVRTQYYGGVLDQFFQAEAAFFQLHPLGRDGRIKAYERLDGGGPITGATRYSFGIDLDGALYDAFYGSLPMPRASDLFRPSFSGRLSPLTAYGTRVAASQRIDLDPNSEQLLAIPVVNNLIQKSGELNELELLPRLGGTSGGVATLFDDRSPLLFAESKLPGADLPGLHGGYLISGKPSQQLDPLTEVVEDDLEDVSLQRGDELGGEAGAPLDEEEVFLGTTQRRRVMAFGGNLDHKLPITTGIQSFSEFVVTTDPIGIAPENIDDWKVKAGLAVRERPSPEDFQFDLLATTQSEGDEAFIKAAADFAVDRAVGLASKVILGTFTAGSCATIDIGSEFVGAGTAAANLWLGPAEDELYRMRVNKARKAAAFIMSGELSGYGTPLKGYKVPALRKIMPFERVLDPATNTKKLKFNPGLTLKNSKIFDHCGLLKLPFSELKKAIKNTYTARTFGGEGSGVATGTKVLALGIPEEARLGEHGIYSAFASVTRTASIYPKELETKKLSELPWQSIWESYPYPDEVSDEELFRTLILALDDESKAADAEDILRTAGAMSIRREMSRDEVEGLELDGAEQIAQIHSETLYQEYKLRKWDMIDVGLYVGPGHELSASEAFGDYALTPNTTMVPVGYGSVVSAGRTNENANAKARVTFNGVEMTLINNVIQEPESQ